MKSYIPQYLHKPNKIALIELDEFKVFANAILLGLILKSVIIFIIGIGLFFAYRRAKAIYPRGFLRHFPHMLGIKQFQDFPNIFIKNFRE